MSYYAVGIVSPEETQTFCILSGVILPYGMLSGVRFYGGGGHTSSTDAIRDRVAIGSTSHSPATIYDVV